ncbi:lysine transporter LysE [Flavobacterium sp.]|uniref:lysine transporter LysE n=1 Tax=Flavobacterium sp. TaxID=239 RepID=UPI00374D3484
MQFVLPLFLGFLASLVGVFPPGIINMTGAKISTEDGKTRALLFTVGALIVVFFQTLIALIFAQYISDHLEIINGLRIIGFLVFSIVTIYFFFVAKKAKKIKSKKIKIKSKKSRFFLGMFISAINFFPIPYYVFVSISLASFNYFVFNAISIYSFVIGVVFGSFVVFYSYIYFFKKIETKTDFIVRNMNSIIGSVTGVAAIIALYQIVKYYFNM